jgi:hypothetical protein
MIQVICGAFAENIISGWLNKSSGVNLWSGVGPIIYEEIDL